MYHLYMSWFLWEIVQWESRRRQTERERGGGGGGGGGESQQTRGGGEQYSVVNGYFWTFT